MLIISILMLIGLVSNAQDRSVILKSNTFFYEFNLSAVDTVNGAGGADTLWQAQALLNKGKPMKYTVQIDLEKVSGAPNADVSFQGKVFSGDPWTTDSTVTWIATSTDTTITFSNITSLSYYRYYNIKVDAASGATMKFKVTDVRVKLWEP